MVMERWRPGREVRHWSPSRELEEWERRFVEIFGHPFLPAIWRTGERGWMPAVDVFEKEDRFVVKAELPGIKEGDIDVSVTDDMLTIKGEKKTETEVKEENYHRSERAYGSFFRSIPIPSGVDTDKVEANYENGVLEVTMPKVAKVKPKKVSVSAKKKSAE